MYKILTLVFITIIIGGIALLMYPPYANQTNEFKLDSKLTTLPDMGTTLARVKQLGSNKNSIKTPFKVLYKPSCEIELYNKFASNIKSKEYMEKYLRRVSSATTAYEVILFQKKLLQETHFSDVIFNDVLNTNLIKNRNFFDKINNRALCSENQ